jgi:CopG family transcriptional regulator, nickel-responsive regulator
MDCYSSRVAKEESAESLRRVTVSMSEETFQALDRLVTERGFDSRSQGIAEMIHAQAAEHLGKVGTEVMAANLTLVYDESKGSLLRDLSRICREHVAEVISSQHVLLEDEHVMEVILMQGPARTLRQIANELVTCKGVKTAQLTLTNHLIPQVHAKRRD